MMLSDHLDRVLEARARHREIERVLSVGLTCECGREATSEQIDRWCDGIERGEVEPDDAWSCPDDVHLCSGCKGAGAPKGARPGEVCPECSGDGEVVTW